MGRALVSQLRGRIDATLVCAGDRFSTGSGEITIRPDEPGDYRQLLETVQAPAAIIHLWSLGTASEHREGSADGSADDALRLGAAGSVLHLLQACTATRIRPRIWLATSGAQATDAAEEVPTPTAAAVWGLGRTLSVEHPDVWGGLVDLDPTATAEASAAFAIREVELGTTEDKIAQRRGMRLAPRLVRQAPAAADPAVSPDGTYVVTGGLGGVGLAIAQWLVANGAREIVLIGRRGLTPREGWSDVAAEDAEGRRIAQVRELEKAGAHVQVSAMDITDHAALAEMLSARRIDGRPPVRGAIHAAGILRFRALAEEDVSGMLDATRAKVDGALALQAALSDAPLDFIVLCSSTSALLPSPLLGAYAAGNACLDALAHQWRAHGVRALSVNWGTWGEVGMAVEAGRTASGELLRGVGTISTSRGLAALAALLAAGTYPGDGYARRLGHPRARLPAGTQPIRSSGDWWTSATRLPPLVRALRDF